MKLSISTERFKRNLIIDIPLILLFIICISNDRDTDFINYENQYNAYGLGQITELLYKYEFLYAKLGTIFYRLGFSYKEFRFFLVLLFFIIFRKVLLDYSKTPMVVLTCFCFFPYLLFCVQIRNAIGSIIVMYGMRFLIENTKKGNIKYILSVIIAALFHETCIIYLILLLANKKRFKRMYIWFTGCLFVIVYTILPTIFAILYKFTSNRRFWYYNTTTPIDVTLRHSLPVVVIIALILYCIKNLDDETEFQNRRELVLGRSSLLICSCILLIRININFSRLIYFMTPIFIMTITNISRNRKHRLIKSDRSVLVGSCFAISIVYFILLLSPLQKETYESVTCSVLPWLK